jgi:hypothetical protein
MLMLFMAIFPTLIPLTPMLLSLLTSHRVVKFVMAIQGSYMLAEVLTTFGHQAIF